MLNFINKIKNEFETAKKKLKTLFDEYDIVKDKIKKNIPLF
jgi:hypothetical protein